MIETLYSKIKWQPALNTLSYWLSYYKEIFNYILLVRLIKKIIAHLCIEHTNTTSHEKNGRKTLKVIKCDIIYRSSGYSTNMCAYNEK